MRRRLNVRPDTELPEIRENVDLSHYTTFELGGPARYFCRATTEDELLALLRWSEDSGLPMHVLGAGSNIVIADDGIDALIVQMAGRGMSIDGPRVRMAAGEPWDAAVARTVEAGLAGLECLSGIPGLAGSTPIQNVGAYGQEVGDVIERVIAVDTARHEVVELKPEDCAFEYRSSRFKRTPGRWIVVRVDFRLRPSGAPTLAYRELKRAIEANAAPTLEDARKTVLRLRRSKSMVRDPHDPNRRSAGSFFTNPIVPTDLADAVTQRALERNIARQPSEVPRYPVATPGHTKLAAGWLIERAGIAKGMRRGAVGISTQHALALVHHGGGTTADLLALASDVRQRVFESWGVTLQPEPTLWGGQWPWLGDTQPNSAT